MNWDRVHHWHLGLIGTIICAVIGLYQMGFENLSLSSRWTIATAGFALWSLDDALYHRYGWKLLFYWIEQGLRWIPLYRKISDWVKKFLK
jgi:hypothetical protein